jgi:flavin-binding protein dodecin
LSHKRSLLKGAKDMATVVKVIELVGTSSESWQHAAEEAIREASQTLRHITGVDAIKHTAHVEGGKIVEYRTTMNVAFIVEHYSHLVGTGAKAAEKR